MLLAWLIWRAIVAAVLLLPVVLCLGGVAWVAIKIPCVRKGLYWWVQDFPGGVG